MSIKSFIRKNGSAVLTGFSIIGVLGTAFFSAKGMEKFLRNEESERPKDSKEKALLYLKSYWPAGLTGSLTISSIIFSHKIDGKTIALLTGACTLAEEKFQKYRNEVRKRLGEEEERDIYAESIESEWHMSPSLPEGDPLTDENTEFFYDEFSEKYFKASLERVQQAMYHLNRNFQMRGYATLNEFREFLGLKPYDLGEVIGWSDIYYLDSGLTPWIDFYCYKKEPENGASYYVITYDVEPSRKALEDIV